MKADVNPSHQAHAEDHRRRVHAPSRRAGGGWQPLHVPDAPIGRARQRGPWNTGAAGVGLFGCGLRTERPVFSVPTV